MPGPASMSESISDFDPRSIAGCQLWLDAIDTSAVTGSSPVTAWRDKSLNASNTTSVAGTNVLTQNAINGRQAIFLNGSSSFTGSTTGSGTTLTVCIVATQSSTCATNGGLVCFGRAGFDDWNDLGSLAITNFGSIGSGQMCSTRTANSQVVNTGVATPFIYVLVFDGTFVNSYLNGTIQTATNIPLTGTFAYTGYKIGTRAGATVNVFWTGFIGEVLVYNTGLTTTERQQIEGYLGWKWGIESTPILPSSISGLAMWLDGADPSTLFTDTGATTAVTADGNSIAAWRDKSTNAYLFTQATAGSRPTYKTSILNGRSITRFNGTSTFLQSSATLPFYTSSTSGGSFFVVFMATTVTTQRFLMTYQNQVTNTYCGTESELGYTTGNNGQGNFGMHQGCSRATIAASGTIVINSYVLMSYILGTTGTTPANSTIFKNGTSLTPSNDQTGFYSAGSYPSANNARFLNIGARVFNGSQATDCFHSGDIAELIWYRTPLSTTERLGVESYLYSKWNIPVPTQALPFTHPFSSIRPFSRYFNPIDIQGCVLWLDATDSSTITRSGTQVTSWRNKGSWDGSAVSRIGVVTSGTATFNGLNIVQFPVGTELGFTVAIPNQARAWFAVFRQTSQVTVAGPNNTQFFAIINQTQGSGQDSLFGPGLPTNIATSSYVMAEGPSGNPNGVQTGNTVPNGFNVMKQYAWINSAISTASNFQNVDGTSYVLTTNFIATAYRIDSVTYTINTNWYNNSCDLAEIIMYNSEISTSQRQQIEGYLAWKWGIQSSLISGHPYTRLPPSSALPFSPTNLLGCVLWLDATDSSTITLSAANMRQWNDKSGLANNMIPFSTFSNATVMSSYWNGLNVLNFSGAGVYQAPASSAVYPIDVYIVMALKDLTTHVDVISLTPSAAVDNFNNLGFSEYITSRWYNGSSSFARTPNTQSATNETSTSFLLMNWSIANNNFVIRRNGTQLSQTASYTWTMTAGSIFQLGWRISPLIFSPGSFAGAFRGYIGEIVAFNSQLTTSQRQVVEGYLASKWGLVSSLPATHPFSKFPPSSALPFSPTNLSGCAVWLDAADLSSITLSGSSVIQWNDKSGNNRNAVQLTPANRPVYSFSDISVDTTTNPAFLNMTSMPAAPYDIFVVGRPIASTTDFRTLFRTNTADPGMNPIVLESGSSRIGYFTSSAFAQFGSYTWAPSTRNLLFARMNASKTMSASLNGVAALTADTAAGTASDVILYMGALVLSGSAPGQQWGRINEVIFYTTPLSTAQRQLVEGYLASKWALQNSLPSTHPYRNFQPAQTSFLIITPGTIATVTLSALSGSGGTITWTTSTNAVSYKWYVGTTFPTALVSGTVGNVLTTAVSYAFLASTNYFAWVIPVSSTGTDGATTQSAAASYTAGVLITTVGAGSVSLGAGSQIVIECWGAGGGSMGQDNTLGAGAGGAFAITTIAQTAAFTLFYSIGAGGIGSQGSGGVGGQTWARVGTNAVPTTSSEGARAAGGNGSGVGFPNNSTQAANSVGQTIFIGGAGGSGGAENGGGGAATPNGNGNNGLAGSGTAGGAAGTGGGGGGGGGGFSLSGGDGISNVLGGGGGGGSYNNAGGMGGLPGGAGGMGWSTGNSAPSGFVNTNPHGFGGDGGRGQIRYTRT